MKYLLDTNVISEPMKARPNPGVVNWLSGQVICFASRSLGPAGSRSVIVPRVLSPDRRACSITSAATPARSIDPDCARTNVEGDPTIRSSLQSVPSVAPASQIRSAQRREPSQVFRCSTQDFLGCGSFALGAVRRLDFHTKKLSNDFPRAPL